MKRFFIGMIIYFCALSTVMLTGCRKDTVVNIDPRPAFSNLTKLGENKIYLAYTLPKARINKFDTLKLSFDYNSSIVKSISVKATMDSEKTWLPITAFSPTNSPCTVSWVPKKSSDVPKYFGVKRCFIRIADSTLDSSIVSDAFSLIGATPVVLLNSLDNDTFHVTDSIKVQYGMNMDLTSNIQTYFKTQSMPHYVEFTRDSKLPSPDEPTILNRQKIFVPAAVDTVVKIQAKNFTEPITIHLEDYSSAEAQLTTGNIIIVP